MKNQSLAFRMRNALSGLVWAWRGEASLRLQSLVALAVVVCLIVVQPGLLWTAVAVVTMAAVVAAELFNTALERLIDHLHPQVHESIRIVKDCAAAAVLVMSMAALVIGGLLVMACIASPR